MLQYIVSDMVVVAVLAVLVGFVMGCLLRDTQWERLHRDIADDRAQLRQRVQDALSPKVK